MPSICERPEAGAIRPNVYRGYVDFARQGDAPSQVGLRSPQQRLVEDRCFSPTSIAGAARRRSAGDHLRGCTQACRRIGFKTPCPGEVAGHSSTNDLSLPAAKGPGLPLYKSLQQVELHLQVDQAASPIKQFYGAIGERRDAGSPSRLLVEQEARRPGRPPIAFSQIHSLDPLREDLRPTVRDTKTVAPARHANNQPIEFIRPHRLVTYKTPFMCQFAGLSG